MIVSDVFQSLSFGEFSNISVSDNGSGSIQEDQTAKVIHYLNEGLLRIYSRFFLKEGVLILKTDEEISHYHLLKAYAESSGSDKDHYILDLEDPFTEDLLKIISVYNLTRHFEHPLNDRMHRQSVFTPQSHILRIPEPITDEELKVTYQAKHIKLYKPGEAGGISVEDVLSQYIDMPVFLEEALRNYVAFKWYSNMNGPENASRSKDFFQSYDMICNDLERKDMPNESEHVSHDKLESRGFV